MSWRAIEAIGVSGPGGAAPARLVELDDDALGPLPDGEVAIDVAWSSLNYKDALALAGRPGIVRVPRVLAGIDVVGVVSASRSPHWAPGDRVLANGGGLGETRGGGLAERVHVPGDALIRVPPAFDLRQAAAIGTAGFTAQLAVFALERGEVAGEVLVTGSSGGVGSFAIALLARPGRRVTAATGSPQNSEMLHALGAAAILDRRELEEATGALQSQRWGGAIDAVGGRILAAVLAQTSYGGVVATCGGVSSAELPTTVMPFILRAVSLVGINSVATPRELRIAAWARLGDDLDPAVVDRIARTIPLDGAITASAELLAGRGRGRLVVDVRGDRD